MNKARVANSRQRGNPILKRVFSYINKQKIVARSFAQLKKKSALKQKSYIWKILTIIPMVRTFTFILLLFPFFQAFSQRQVDVTEVQLKRANNLQETYPEEDIVVLSKTLDLSFEKNRNGTGVEVVRKNKVHLMNIAPNSHIQYPVFYDSGSAIENFELNDSKGRNLDDFHSEFFDEYVNDQSIFHSDYRVKYTNIIFPLLGANYKIETEKKFNEIKYFTSEYFSGMFRTLNGKIVVHVPHWLDLEIHEFNFELEHSGEISKKTVNSEEGKTITYTFSNIKGQSQKPNTPGRSHLYPHLVFVAKSFTEDGKTTALFNDVGDLYAWYNKLVHEVKVDPSVFSGKVEELTASAKTDIEKIKNIYYWVQDNIRYIAFEDGIAGFRPDSPQHVFQKRYGDCKGMAFLTKAMLQKAGFDARLVWIGTDRLAYDYSVPSLVVNNHMICAVKLNGAFVFLDATEKYNQFGAYATRIQGKEGLVQAKDGYKIIAVPSSKRISNIDSTHYSFSIEKGVLKANANRYFSGECRSGFQNAYTSFGSKDRTEALARYLTSGNNNILVKEILPFDPENREKPLTISYELEVANAIAEFDGTLYIDIDPVKKAGGMLFEERKSPFKFPIKKQKTIEIGLLVPEGYTVGLLPEDFHLENELVDFSLDYELSEGKISYKKELKLKKRLVQPADFDVWNQAFSTIKEKINRQITLVKNQS